MAYREKDQIEWYLFGEHLEGTTIPTSPEGNANRPLDQLYDNSAHIKNIIDNQDFITNQELLDTLDNYYTKTEIDNLINNVEEGITIHSQATGKQGGTTNEYYHLSQANYNDLTSTTQASQNIALNIAQSDQDILSNTVDQNLSSIITLENSKGHMNPANRSNIPTITLTPSIITGQSNSPYPIIQASRTLTDDDVFIYIKHVLYFPVITASSKTDWKTIDELSSYDGYHYSISGNTIYLYWSTTGSHIHLGHIHYCIFDSNFNNISSWGLV